MIILTADDADKVRGLSAAGHALAPRPLADGSFALSETVLADPAHTALRPLLAALPRRNVADHEWPAVDGEEAGL